MKITTKEKENAQLRIRTSRERHHILKYLEFKVIDFLCPRIPNWISPDMLTIIGLLGSVIITLSMIYSVVNPIFLAVAVLGFAIQWLGDSLDGRIAYYRNTPRKWYGWVLDINADWLSISLIGLGFYFYLPIYKFLAFIFVLAYGGSMILTLLRYKINDTYVIDKGILGPTEFRIIICSVLLFEFFVPGLLLAFITFGSLILIVMNVIESINVIKAGDTRDHIEKTEKTINANLLAS